MTRIEYRQGIYVLLSEALKEPTDAFVAEQRVVAEFLGEAWRALHYDEQSEDLVGWPVSVGDLQKFTKAYCTSFRYPPESRVIPVESVYRRWTYDETVDLPFAREKGYLMSDAALHMKTLYESCGLDIPEEYQGMPDHLCLQLEFCAYLLTSQDEQHLQVFLAEHLDWVHELYEEMQFRQVSEFYQGIVRLVCRFLTCERRLVV